MLTKETKTVEVDTYFFNGKGPYDTPKAAIKGALQKHLYSANTLSVEDFLNDKELLIALGEWAKNA